jgi:hypothetical protein
LIVLFLFCFSLSFLFLPFHFFSLPSSLTPAFVLHSLFFPLISFFFSQFFRTFHLLFFSPLFLSFLLSYYLCPSVFFLFLTFRPPFPSFFFP